MDANDTPRAGNLTPLVNRYHCLSFANLEEGAAYAAALSRFLASPGGFGPAMPADSSMEVLVAASEDLCGLRVFLSSAALEASADAFGAADVIATGGPELLPSTRVTIVSGADRGPYGKDDILRRIANAEADKRFLGL